MDNTEGMSSQPPNDTSRESMETVYHDSSMDHHEESEDVAEPDLYDVQRAASVTQDGSPLSDTTSQNGEVAPEARDSSPPFHITSQNEEEELDSGPRRSKRLMKKSNTRCLAASIGRGRGAMISGTGIIETPEAEGQQSSQTAMTESTPAQRYRLRIAIDYGTVNLAVAYDLKCIDAEEDGLSQDIVFDSQYTAPMWLYWDDDGIFHWGREVENMVRRKDIDSSQALHMPKLALYSAYSTYRAATILDEQIKDLRTKLDQSDFSIVDIISTHFEAVVDHTVRFVASQEKGSKLEQSGIKIADVPPEVHISVPQAWDPSSNNVMSDAAKQAGLEGQLVLEPQCVAAWAMHNHITLKRQLRLPEDTLAASTKGKRQLVVDAGGGTVDLVKYEMLADTGAKCKLKTIGGARGDLIGSATINEAFADDFVDNYPTDAATSNRRQGQETLVILRKTLGTPDEPMCVKELHKQLANKFEQPKKDYPNLEDPVAFNLRFKSVQTVEVPRDDVGAALDAGITKVTNMIDALLDSETTMMIVSGGFGKCGPLFSRLEQLYDKRLTIYRAMTDGSASLECSTVTHGALLRHTQVDPEGLPMEYSYFTAQDQSYDENIHEDAKNDPSLRIDDYSPQNDGFVVEDRISYIVKKGQTVHDQQVLRAGVFSNWRMSDQDKRIRMNIYWTKKDLPANSKLEDHVEDEDYRLWRAIDVPISDDFLRNKLHYSRPNAANGYWWLEEPPSTEAGIEVGEKGKNSKIKNLKTATSQFLHQLWEDVVWTANFSRVINDSDWVDRDRDGSAAIAPRRSDQRAASDEFEGNKEANNPQSDPTSTISNPQDERPMLTKADAIKCGWLTTIANARREIRQTWSPRYLTMTSITMTTSLSASPVE